nr:hypothetical protein [Aphanizomenon flos-aquae]
MTGNREQNKKLLPITNYQLPITNYQLPITNYQSPITKNAKSINVSTG